MIYKLEYKKKAIKALAKINEPYYSAIIEAIEGLSKNATIWLHETYWKRWLSD